ncbi:ribosomal protein S5 domain 2-type protein [Abortiporus biennis]|nr:ribosomal protein S5 domain 2-type protein [Abortiporus biennis]
MASISKSEKAYIQASLLSSNPLRADGRGLHDYRTVSLETGVAPLANGSARVNFGKAVDEGGGGTEVLAATKLEIEDVKPGEGEEGGRIVCTVTCSPAAYPQLSSNALDELQYDYTTILHQTFSHPSLHPTDLGIIPHKKSWLLNVDLVVLSDAGNIYDALFMSARAALWDTKVPVTRAVQYVSPQSDGARGKTDTEDTMEVEGVGSSSLDTRHMPTASDFELSDYWDEGAPLSGREKWPVCVTLNIHSTAYFLDATLLEEASIPLKLLVVYTFPSPTSSSIQALRLVGPGELQLPQIEKLLQESEPFARQLHTTLNTKLKDEDIRRNQKARDRFALRS